MERPETTAEKASGPSFVESAPARPSTMAITGLTRMTAIMMPAQRRTCPHRFLSTSPAYTTVPSSAPTYSRAARMTSSSQRTPAARIDTIDTTISMIGPPPMSSPLASAPEKVPKNVSVWSPVALARTSVTPSVAETTV